MFAGGKGRGSVVPCVGVSMGVERIFTIMEVGLALLVAGLITPAVLVATLASSLFALTRCGWVHAQNRLKERGEGVRLNETEVLVASGQKGLLLERMKLIAELWAAGIKAEQVEKANPNLMKQFEFAENARIPSIVIVGTDELERGVVKLRSTQSREDRKAKKPGDEREVKRADLVAEIKARR
mmetsp:Transcript_24335/g.72781  ORF Transcript_24335/g.72781 Transcript_24335/m.72781 type:complete len:183 (-) Transcript_24335:706-1254(-)